MSTILKALRRLEEQRTQGEGRPLREEVAAGPRAPESPAAPRRWIRWAAGGVGVIVIAIAAGVALRQWPLADGAEPVDVAAQPAPAPEDPVGKARANSPVQSARPPLGRTRPASVQPALAAGALPASEHAPIDPSDDPPAGLPDRAFASPVEVVPRPPAEPRKPMKIARAADPLPDGEVAEPAPAAKPAPAPTGAPAPVGAKSAPAPQPGPAAAPVPTPRSAGAPAPERIAAAEPEPEAPAPTAPTPVVDAEPQEFSARATEPSAPPAASPESRPEPGAGSAEPRREVPPVAPGPSTLLVAKTLWHPQSDRRVAFVSLDGAEPRRIQEGDVVGRYVVSEIQPSGVVFLDDGQKLRRAIGAK